MNKNFTAKRYFIDGLRDYIKNEHKCLSKIYTPSIRELLLDYVEIHEDIISNLELDKLGNARNQLIEAMKYYIKTSLLFENSLYKNELLLLISLMDKLNGNSEVESKIQYSHMYNICNSLIKKINSNNIYSQIVSLVKTYTNFNEAERAIHLLINELMYDGYSLKYLDSWMDNFGKTEITEENIDVYLDRLCILRKHPNRIEYYISVFENQYFIDEKLFIDFNLSLIKQDFDNLDLGVEKGKKRKDFLQVNSGYVFCKIEIIAQDCFKGLEHILSAINSYFQMIDYVTNETKKQQPLFQDRTICKLPDGTYKKIRITDGTPADTKILFSRVENRERQDVEDFILYRGKVFSNDIKSQEVFNIQRALNIVKSQLHQSQENKIINLWAVLEYILTFKESNGSIISKVKDIIPKITCLYIMKDKVNVFWSRLYGYKDKGIPIVDEVLKCKKEGHEYQYELNPLIKLILDKGPNIVNEFEFDNNLARCVSEIGGFLIRPKTLFKYLENKKEEIKHDIVRSYRARNVLIHSGRETRVNLNFKALRLYCYNNNLLGLIIYYLYKNPNFKITEILNSIDYTYDNYIKGLHEESIIQEEICKPKYLFIG